MNAQTPLETVLDVSFPRKGGVNQKEVFDKAIEKASLSSIEQIIGEQKAAKNLALIRGRIIRDSGKYIEFIKSENPTVVGDELRYPVRLRLSVKNLESLLLQEGLLYKSDGLPKLLPMITISDRVNSQSYSWWSQPVTSSLGVLPDLTKRVHLELRDGLRSRGFFGLEPVSAGLRSAIPASLQSENPGTDEMQLLCEYFQAQVIAKGQVIVSSERTRADVYKIEVKVVALHASNGRVIGEVIRTYNTEPGPFQQVVRAKLDEALDKLSSDLAMQILEAWKSGTFGASLLRVAVRGGLSYSQLFQFKKLLLEQVRDLKTLKERMFEPGQVIFETDSSASPDGLAASIRGKTFPRFQVTVSNVSSSGIDLRVESQ